MKLNRFILNILTGILYTGLVTAQTPHLFTVNADQPITAIQPTMWGVFFEDINMGADGGIYAELVKNRSFEFTKPLMGWKINQQTFKEGEVLVMNRQGKDLSNPRYLRVSADHEESGALSITNEGFRGMGIKKGVRYDFSFLSRLSASGIILHIDLINPANEIIGSTVLTPSVTGENWVKQAVSFIATATEPKAQLRIGIEGTGILDMDIISLFPSDTWKNRPGGLRADMIQLLADLKPGFIRFPGGCIVEGYDLSQRYQWKKTVGPVDERQLLINRWNYEMPNRQTPDYFQTFGVGFYEYFQLAEDLGATALPILNCGMACQFNSAELVPADQLDPYIQDALDLIEFANGSPESVWGKVRASMGHPAPFNLKMMGIGNENWGPQYLERLKLFQKAIKVKYPQIQLVNSSGTDPDGERFDSLNTALRNMHADIIDEHYYRRPEWFFQNTHRYDSYPRNGSKVFAGEYAAQSDKTVSLNNKNSWLTALSEAAFMTGLERNAAVVNMASYAPLFAHAEGWQWTPDLIWVDNLRSYGTPDYYVQKLFSTNRGSAVIAITAGKDVIAGQDSVYASAAIDSVSHEVIIKLVNASSKEYDSRIILQGKIATEETATLQLLQNNDLNAMNSFDQPANISPKASTITVNSKKINYKAAPYSFSVIKIRLKK